MIRMVDGEPRVPNPHRVPRAALTMCWPTFAIALAIGAAACAGDSVASGSPVTVRDSAGIRIIETAAPTAPDGIFGELAADAVVSIGEEEGPVEYQLHRVYDAHQFADGRIAIANSGTFEIRFHDAGGRFIGSAGRRGAGPGEFGAPASIRLYPHHDTLFATDRLRLNVYAPDGRFFGLLAVLSG